MSDWLQRLGVEQIVLPARGPLRAERSVRQKKRWFRRGQAWRAGIEPRIATLKHRFGMQRAFYKGEAGFERHVAFCVLAHNLVAMSRAGPSFPRRLDVADTADYWFVQIGFWF